MHEKNSFSDIDRKCGAAFIGFGKMHFLLISENEFFFHEIKRDGMTIFIEFMTLFLCSV